MATYLLVHGSWHGAWCWEEVIPLLKNKNHQVFAPDLPGHGNNPAPLKGINFNSYVACLSQLMDAIQEPIILVGHSMAGLPISQVAQQYPTKIRELVFLAGFLPQDGESLISIAQKQPLTSITKAIHAITQENALTFPLEHMKEFAYNRCSDSLLARILPRFCVEPLAPSITPVKINREIFDKISRVYIECTDDNAITIDSQRRMQKETPCTVYSLDCDHSPFYSDPKGLVEILASLV
jgi:pimeloyl-ACP methyl ester carboxylesterase